MNSDSVRPADCRTMAEVRRGIDRIDERIMALIAERFRYMDAAARIKLDRATVRDETRKAEVIANARRAAKAAGFPEMLAAELYETLIEASIAYEFDRFDALDGTA